MWGKSAKCVPVLPVLPVDTPVDDGVCSGDDETAVSSATLSEDNWCTQTVIAETYNQVCPLGGGVAYKDSAFDKKYCTVGEGNDAVFLENLPEGLK